MTTQPKVTQPNKVLLDFTRQYVPAPGLPEQTQKVVDMWAELMKESSFHVMGAEGGPRSLWLNLKKEEPDIYSSEDTSD